MYLENVGYEWGNLSELGVEGAIFRASGQDLEASLRRDKGGFPSKIFFDPQLYFLDFDLTPDTHTTVLAKLVTYPWFGVNVPTFESGEAGGRKRWTKEIRDALDESWTERVSPLDDWEETVKRSVEFQVQFGVTAVLLPATLIADPESSLEEDFARLDTAVSVAAKITKKPLVACLPLEDNVLRHRTPTENTFLEALADGISAREQVGAAYVTVVSTEPTKDKITAPRVAGAVLRLTKLLSKADVDVFLNFVESLGRLGLAMGAKAYGSGYSTKAQRLCEFDFRERDGGGSYPRFHSLRLGAVDLRPEQDLERMFKKRLRYVLEDQTDAAAPLLAALAAGRSSRTVPSWVERKGNLPTAKLHYSQIHCTNLDAMKDLAQAFAWIQEAEAAWMYVSERFKDDPLTGDGSHLTPWRTAFEKFV